MRLVIRKAFLSIGILLLLPLQALPLMQKQNNSNGAVKLSVDLVLVEAEVLNKKTGQAVEGLKREDFILYEDGIRQQITHFSKDKLPLSVLILLDVSGSVWATIKKLREGALEALQNLKPEDEVAVMIFAKKPKLALYFTKDKQLAAKAIETANAQEVGDETDTNEAVFQAAAYIKNATNPENRRVIIAISDDVSTHKVLSLSKSKTIHELLESGSTVCGLLFNSIYKTKPEPNTDPLGGGLQTILISGETDIIKSYVDRTGGLAIEADQQSVKEGFIYLIERLRTRYSLGYVSSNEKQDGKLRRIKLRISPDVDKREKGTAIITRKGYYARQTDRSAGNPK